MTCSLYVVKLPQKRLHLVLRDNLQPGQHPEHELELELEVEFEFDLELERKLKFGSKHSKSCSNSTPSSNGNLISDQNWKRNWNRNPNSIFDTPSKAEPG